METSQRIDSLFYKADRITIHIVFSNLFIALVISWFQSESITEYIGNTVMLLGALSLIWLFCFWSFTLFLKKVRGALGALEYVEMAKELEILQKHQNLPLDSVTQKKVSTIIERDGYTPCGLILNKDERRCYVDMGRVTWSKSQLP